MSKILDRISIKIFKYILKFQQEKHKKRMDKLNKKILSGKICGEAHHSVDGVSLAIESKAKEKTKANEEKIEKILNNFIDNPKELFNYIKGAKTPVYKTIFAKKILSLIKEDEGFILPKKGMEALYLNLILNKKISFKTKEMFVISSYEVNKTILAYQFYIWYSYKMKLEGYENEVQDKFKNIFNICETNKIEELTYEEILELKSAIKRDIEAINFVKKYSQKKYKAKEAIDKIKEGKKISV